jgi:exodeoxyribonuclease VII small subunit
VPGSTARVLTRLNWSTSWAMLRAESKAMPPWMERSDRMANKDQSDKKFESALEELEGVVEQLESGDLSLEDALAAFEKGVGLVKYCNQKLNEVERKVELLLKDKEGRLQLKLLDSLAGDEEKDE